MKGHCIYFLIDSGMVVYIGQTINIKTRLLEHRKNKQFDNHRVIYCSFNKLNFYEERWINKFKPKYNKLFTSRRTRDSKIKIGKQLYIESYIWDLIEESAGIEKRSVSNWLEILLIGHFLKAKIKKS